VRGPRADREISDRARKRMKVEEKARKKDGDIMELERNGHKVGRK